MRVRQRRGTAINACFNNTWLRCHSALIEPQLHRNCTIAQLNSVPFAATGRTPWTSCDFRDEKYGIPGDGIHDSIHGQRFYKLQSLSLKVKTHRCRLKLEHVAMLPAHFVLSHAFFVKTMQVFKNLF